MSPKTIWLLAVLVVCAYPAAASTYYVGTCKSGSFSTISAAVTAAPSGSTIMICAGQYTEQVIISKDLTLKGLNSSTADGGTGAVIFPPDTLQTTTSPIFGFNKNPILGGPIAPVIWVTAGTVTIENVFVTNKGDSPCPGNTKTVGFYYATGASGTLNHVGFFPNDMCAVGIWAENASFTHTAVTVENSYSAAGIVAASLLLQDGTLTVTIKGNQVFPTSPDGTYGIYLHSVSGIVDTNLVSGPRVSLGALTYGTAILDDGVAQTDVTISGNTIQEDGYQLLVGTLYSSGIVLTVDGAKVKSNKISGLQYGIDVGCHAGTVSGNTISNVNYGLANAPAGSTGVNTFYNVMGKFFGSC
jgi:nitrous oxidase accessory protein NosD